MKVAGVVGGGGGKRELVEAAAEGLANCFATWEFLGTSIGEGEICTRLVPKHNTKVVLHCGAGTLHFWYGWLAFCCFAADGCHTDPTRADWNE